MGPPWVEHGTNGLWVRCSNQHELEARKALHTVIIQWAARGVNAALWRKPWKKWRILAYFIMSLRPFWQHLMLFWGPFEAFSTVVLGSKTVETVVGWRGYSQILYHLFPQFSRILRPPDLGHRGLTAGYLARPLQRGFYCIYCMRICCHTVSFISLTLRSPDPYSGVLCSNLSICYIFYYCKGFRSSRSI